MRRNPMAVLFVVLIALAIFALIGVSIWAGRRPVARNEQGEFMLRYTWPVRGFSFSMGILVPAAILILALIYPPDGSLWLVVAGLAGFFGLLGGGLFVETQFVRIVVSDEAIRCHSPWMPERALKWEEIDAVRTISMTYPFIFEGKDDTVFRVSAMMSGIKELVQTMRDKLNPKVYQEAARGMAMWSEAEV